MLNTDTSTRLADITTPRVGLGCMGMSDFYEACDQHTALRALHTAFDLGYRHFDTADMYGNGANEALLGQFLEELGGRRQEALVATKVGIKREDGPTPAIKIDSSPEHIRSACDASLQRLGIEQIGLLYLHRRSPEVPIEETVGAMMELVAQGKVRNIGLSEVSRGTLEKACAVAPIAALQSEYSLWSRDVEDSILDVCALHNIAFVAYSPLGRGFLTGAFKKPEASGDLRNFLPRFQDGNLEKNLALVEVVNEIAKDIGCLPSQVALAWVLAQDSNIHVIPGSTKSKHLTSNFGSLYIDLSDAQKQRLSAVFAPDAIQGARYPEQVLHTVNV